ncbi:hypothetical protein KY290_033700 [Solanum tuberosum]|uniref:Transmembrane protein n=1 Tax=Solanum tuberosum TaxID=4113 RepID=A0ABQ7U2Y6_SOLTU|nr:hypothetical protein KY289_033072 [Solanum tuberosum]KAH0647715.1 hypothetical protein KY285_032963 [Solanum tuberosum]KAH0740657.1 hypothetical protein KY290_033700 [Solanum tuberosum]
MHSQLKCTRTDLLKIRLLTRLKTFQTSPELASSLAGAVFAGVGAGFRWLLLPVGGSLFSLAVAGRSWSPVVLASCWSDEEKKKTEKKKGRKGKEREVEEAVSTLLGSHRSLAVDGGIERERGG